MIARDSILTAMRAALEAQPGRRALGPRQCGKTTLARQLLAPDSANYFDLEDPASLARLEEPMTALRPLEGLVVIDEVQRRPDLFPVLRVLVDRRPNRRRGSSSWAAPPATCCARRPRASPDASSASSSAASRWPEVGAECRSTPSGVAVAFPCRYLARARRTASRGAASSSRRCWSAICRSGACACRRRRCAASGPSSRTTTGRLERGRRRAHAGRERRDSPPLPRPADRRVHGAAAAAVARQPAQAAGEVAQGLRARQRPAAHVAGHRTRRRSC